MLIIRNLAATLLLVIVVCTGSSMVRAADCEDIVARHMVGEALLAAHFVALFVKIGMETTEINAILKSIAEKSALQEFWITDSSGRAYLTNTGIDFTFSPDSAKQPQASEFWPLIGGGMEIISNKRASAKSMTACLNTWASLVSTRLGSFRSVSAGKTFRIANSFLGAAGKRPLKRYQLDWFLLSVNSPAFMLHLPVERHIDCASPQWAPCPW